MNGEPLARLEREVLGWPAVGKRSDEDGPGGVPVTSYGFEEREIGHVHHGQDDYLVDFRFPRVVRDELIRTGQAIPHPVFPDSRTSASYWIRSAEDVPGAVVLFRLSYERAKGSAERRGSNHERTL